MLCLTPAALAADYAPDEIIVRFKPGKAGRLAAITLGTGIRTKRVIDKLGFYSLKLPKGANLEKTIARYRNDPAVEYVGPNHFLHIAALFPNDPVFYTGDEFWAIPQWGLYNYYDVGARGPDIHAPEAWEITTGSPNVVIAVLDTGIDFTHPDLVDKIWTNPDEIPGNGVDDDHNGYIDDVNGWNFVSNNAYPIDDHEIYHGSLISGIAAASSYNGIGIAGVSWGSPIMPLKVIAADGSGLEDDAAAAAVYATDRGAKVINMSFSGLHTPLLQQSVEYAWQHGSICVCATGNEGRSKVTYPASYEHAMAVGATDEYDERWVTVDMFGRIVGSNYGDYLDVMAPGSFIVSTGRFLVDLGLAYEPYDTESGTSAAAPFVSGVAALVWSVHPDWDNQKVFFHILHTADDISLPGWDIETGWGRVNAYRAVGEEIRTAPSVSAVKQMVTNTEVELKAKVVSTACGSLPGRLYIQDKDRTAGIALVFSGSVPTGFAVGDIVNVLGLVGSVSGSDTVSGERAILNPIVTKIPPSIEPPRVPKPLGMTNKAMGGGRFGLQGEVVDQYYDPQTRAVGANNIGLLVRVFGKVTRSTYGYFYIDDGSKLKDGSGDIGVRVDCGALSPPEANRWAAVTGISSCEVPAGANARRRVLRPRVQSDIKIVK